MELCSGDHMSLQTHTLTLFLALFGVVAQAAEVSITATLIDVKKIADDAPHSAFTDLIHWKGQLICAFRQGRGHVSADGRITVLSSTDGDRWDKAAELKLPGFDLRDASLSETPDGKLMLLGGASPREADGKSAPTGTFVAFSEDARHWTTPQIVIEPGRWLWRVTWHAGRAYGVSYATPDDHPAASLLVSDDGKKFDEAVPRLLDKGYPTEAVIRFGGDGTAYCLQRRDGKPAENSAFLGISKAPYTEWSWRDLGIFFGGPNLLQLPDGRWIAAGRIMEGGVAKTVVASLDVPSKSLVPILTLPSGGDTSYPGLVWHKDVLLVTYYSSHEGKAAIYLAKVQVEP